MMEVREAVINKIISEKKLGPTVNIGIGVTYGDVIVTKIGIPDIYDVKAFGDCINIASKYANETVNEVEISKKVKDKLSHCEFAEIETYLAKNGEAYYIRRKSDYFNSAN